MPVRRVILAALMAWHGQAMAGPDAGDATAALLRTTLTVADVDRSKDFYALLGFVAESEMGGSRDPESPFPLNSKASQWRLVILASATGAGGKIGLLSFDDAPPRPVRDMARERIGLGDTVFVFDVADARATHAHLVGAGADILEEPVNYRSALLDGQGKPMAGWVFHVFDPDGYLIEILEAPRPARPRALGPDDQPLRPFVDRADVGEAGGGQRGQ